MKKNNRDDFRESLVRYLQDELDVAYIEHGGSELVVRCPFCGDSQTNLRKGHMYIQLDFKDDELPGFNCVKCGTYGRVTKHFLSLLTSDNIDTELLNTMKLYGKNIGKNVLRTIRGKNNINLNIPMPLNNRYTLNKLKYIENRLGIKITGEDITKYKIIFNIFDFLQINKVDKITRKPNLIQLFDTDYIGFLSINKEYITFRNIGEVNDYRKRYYVYNIFGLRDNTENIYTIGNSINMMKDVDIVLTEGVMDILGVYNHIEDKNDKNTIYCACLGVGYYGAIMHFIRNGCIFINEIRIYSDSDQSINMFRDIKNRLRNRTKAQFIVIKNKIKLPGAKKSDFGVRSDQIDCEYYYL